MGEEEDLVLLVLLLVDEEVDEVRRGVRGDAMLSLALKTSLCFVPSVLGLEYLQAFNKFRHLLGCPVSSYLAVFVLFGIVCRLRPFFLFISLPSPEPLLPLSSTCLLLHQVASPG